MSTPIATLKKHMTLELKLLLDDIEKHLGVDYSNTICLRINNYSLREIQDYLNLTQTKTVYRLDQCSKYIQREYSKHYIKEISQVEE